MSEQEKRRIWVMHCPFRKDGTPVLGTFGGSIQPVVIFKMATWVLSSRAAGAERWRNTMIETIAVGNAADDQVSVTLRGTPAEVVRVLVNGLSREALEQLNDAIQAEMDARKLTKTENS